MTISIGQTRKNMQTSRHRGKENLQDVLKWISTQEYTKKRSGQGRNARVGK